MIDTFPNAKDLQLSIKDRWGLIDLTGPSLQVVATILEGALLMYADSSVHFSGGGFQGIQYVYNLLKSRAYYYVDFSIDFAHRDGTDPSATIPDPQTLVSLDIVNKYDEVWFFGFNSTPNLSPAEITLIGQFMSAPKFGGVLVRGDHADLGKGIAGQIPRAGVMRLYPAPPNSPPIWNTTVEEGPDPGATFDFNDQSDDLPQSIRFKRYPLGSTLVFRRNYRPHPVLCARMVRLIYYRIINTKERP
jgi:hypothetical protein